jgi:hypothetical protein
MADFYVTEERAFAPGIAGNWPKVIVKPDNPNGRLVKLDGLQDRMNGIIEELIRLSKMESIPEQQRQIIAELVNALRSVF